MHKILHTNSILLPIKNIPFKIITPHPKNIKKKKKKPQPIKNETKHWKQNTQKNLVESIVRRSIVA